MRRSLLLIGGGGHCASCIEVIQSLNEWKILGIVDRRELIGNEVLGFPIIGTDDGLPALFDRCKDAMITVGQIQSSDSRVLLFEKLSKIGFSLPSIFSKSAIVSSHSNVREGTIVMHGAIVNARAEIGRNCICNSMSLIEHDAVVGDHCHISTGAIVNGGASIGDRCFVGSGAVIRNGIKIASGCVIGAGCVVIRDITESGSFVGNPARNLS